MQLKISGPSARINRRIADRSAKSGCCQNFAVVLPLERLKIRKVVRPTLCNRRDMTDFPPKVGQRFAMRAVLHPGAEPVAAIEVPVVPVGNSTLRPHAQL